MRRGKSPVGEAEAEKSESISLIDKDLQAACNESPFAGTQPK